METDSLEDDPLGGNREKGKWPGSFGGSEGEREYLEQQKLKSGIDDKVQKPRPPEKDYMKVTA